MFGVFRMRPSRDYPSHEFERMPNGRYRYPRKLSTLALEFSRIQIYRHRDVMDMRTYCLDVRRELNRVQKYRGQYHRQRAEISRLRLLVRSLRDQRSNVALIKQQKAQLEAQKSRIVLLQKTMQEMRQSRCRLYRDWQSTHSRCSELQKTCAFLQSECELARSQTIAIKKCLAESSK